MPCGNGANTIRLKTDKKMTGPSFFKAIPSSFSSETAKAFARCSGYQCYRKYWIRTNRRGSPPKTVYCPSCRSFGLRRTASCPELFLPAGPSVSGRFLLHQSPFRGQIRIEQGPKNDSQRNQRNPNPLLGPEMAAQRSRCGTRREKEQHLSMAG